MEPAKWASFPLSKPDHGLENWDPWGRGGWAVAEKGARTRLPPLLAVPGSQLPFRGQACLDGQGLVGGVVDELRVVGVQAWVLSPKELVHILGGCAFFPFIQPPFCLILRPFSPAQVR